MKVRLLRHTENPAELVLTAMGKCYDSSPSFESLRAAQGWPYVNFGARGFYVGNSGHLECSGPACRHRITLHSSQSAVL